MRLGRITGRSAAWLARLPWEQEVTSSNLVAPIRDGSPGDRTVVSRRRSAVASNTDSAKDRAALAGARLVEGGMVVGLGSGSTAALMVRHLATRVDQQGLQVVGVPTSAATAELARGLKIPVRALDDVAVLDLNLDGADEIDPQFRMIK